MKAVIDSYIGLWLVLLFLMMCIAFTSINLNIVQARKMFNDIKAQVQASNGSFIGASNVYSYSSTSSGGSTTNHASGANVRELKKNGYQFAYKVERKQMTNTAGVKANNETWIYNDLYLITFEYQYAIPLFRIVQTYPIKGYTY